MSESQKKVHICLLFNYDAISLLSSFIDRIIYDYIMLFEFMYIGFYRAGNGDVSNR